MDSLGHEKDNFEVGGGHPKPRGQYLFQQRRSHNNAAGAPAHQATYLVADPGRLVAAAVEINSVKQRVIDGLTHI